MMFNYRTPPSLDKSDILDEIIERAPGSIDFTSGRKDKEKLYDSVEFLKTEAINEAEEQYIIDFKGKNPININENVELAKIADENINIVWSTFKKYGSKNMKEIDDSEKCPCCGLFIKTNDSLDHVLPKDKFNNLIVFPKNLVRMCSNCNNSKQNNIYNPSELFHPYFDNWNIPITDVRVKFHKKDRNRFHYEFILDEKHPDIIQDNYSVVYNINSSYLRYTEVWINDNISTPLRRVEDKEKEMQEVTKRTIRKMIIDTSNKIKYNTILEDQILYMVLEIILNNFDLFYKRL